MIMICRIVAMAMQRPVHVFGKAVRVSVIGDHGHMVLDGFEDIRGMGERGHDGPDR